MANSYPPSGEQVSPVMSESCMEFVGTVECALAIVVPALAALTYFVARTHETVKHIRANKTPTVDDLAAWYYTPPYYGPHPQ